jgi:hypothetical protein
VLSWLLLGFAMGVRHALEADHLAAVASLSARAAGPAALLRVAGAWGVGHAFVIVAIACLWVATGVALSEQAQPFVEAAAGLLLVWLGVDLLRERDGTRAAVRVHEHRSGTVHAHLHWEAASDTTAPVLDHAHPHAPLRRALFVGSLHGLGGSALLGLLAANGAHASLAIGYAVLFGAGATIGMLALSTVVSFPLRWPRVRAAAAGRSARVAIGLVSIAVGTWIGARSLLQIAPAIS